MTKEQEWDKFGYVVRDSYSFLTTLESWNAASAVILWILHVQDQIRFGLHVQDGLLDVVEDYLETAKKDCMFIGQLLSQFNVCEKAHGS